FSFSSRRRHTRFKCDWSSDVCSSDLPKHQDPASKLQDPDSLSRAEDRLEFGPWIFTGAWTLDLGASAVSSDRRCAIAVVPELVRSEERRVGNECAWLWL